MGYVYAVLCVIGGALVAYGLLKGNVLAVIVGAVAVLACAAASEWSKRRTPHGTDHRR